MPLIESYKETHSLNVMDQVDVLFPTIICGDFNTVWDRAVDRCGPVSPHGLMASPIDLFGFPLAWSHLMHLCNIVPCPFSDHDAVCLTASLPKPFARGPGRWLFSGLILQNPSFSAALETMWLRWRAKKQTFSSIQNCWGRGKDHIKRLASSCSSWKKLDARKSIVALVALADHLKAKVDYGALSLLDVYGKVPDEIAALDCRSDAARARVRSKIQWAKKGEMSSRFFLRIKSKRSAESWISAMRLHGFLYRWYLPVMGRLILLFSLRVQKILRHRRACWRVSTLNSQAMP